MARNRPLFLGQRTYRARRLGDAARLLPILGVLLFLLPLLIRPANPSTTFLYVFGTWGLLILVVAVMSPGLAKIGTGDDLASDKDQDAGDPAADTGADGS